MLSRWVYTLLTMGDCTESSIVASAIERRHAVGLRLKYKRIAYIVRLAATEHHRCNVWGGGQMVNSCAVLYL